MLYMFKKRKKPMKKSLGLAIATLILGSFIGVGLFNAFPYSNLLKEYDSLQGNYQETQNELYELRENVTQLTDELYTLMEGYRSLEGSYQGLIVEHSLLENYYSELLNDWIRAQSEPIAPFTVRGKSVCDRFGRNVSMKGFALDEVMFSPEGYNGRGPYEKEHLQMIKDWGFHFVYSELFWGHVELSQDDVGEYDYQYFLVEYHPVIDWADEVGLNWIFRFRVSVDDSKSGTEEGWWGWPTASYVCTEEGLSRYCDFLRNITALMEDRHDNIVAYQPWQFPFHITQYTEAQEDFFFERVVPEMIKAVRNVTSKPIIIAPTYPYNPDFVDLINFDDRLKTEDTNVIYAFSFYHPSRHGIESADDQEIWEGTPADIDEQNKLLEPAIEFSNEYDVPLNVFEFGINLEREDQLNKLRLKLELLDEHDIGWCYWWYSWWDEQYVGFNLFYPGGVPKQDIVDLLIEYNEWR